MSSFRHLRDIVLWLIAYTGNIRPGGPVQETHMTSARLVKPLVIGGILLAALMAPGLSLAQDRGRDNNAQVGSDVPYAGADLAYDYVTGEYYRYTGPQPQDPRTREQTGYRDGTNHTPPLTWYRSGVRWIGAGYGRGCRCSNIWYGRHHSYSLDYYRDEIRDYDRSRYDQHSYRRSGYRDRYW